MKTIYATADHEDGWVLPGARIEQFSSLREAELFFRSAFDAAYDESVSLAAGRWRDRPSGSGVPDGAQVLVATLLGKRCI